MQVHRNNVGLLRLIFAATVIVGHAPEMMDGNRSREPLTAIFHTLSLGELAVDAFFLLSGYLIAQSMARTGSLRSYLERRVLRIYPAFVVAYLLSVFVLGPIVGAHPWSFLPTTLARLVILHSPEIYPGQLAGLPYPDLNGAMWTISYEFRCYLLVAVLGISGLLSRKRVMLGLTIMAMAVSVLYTFHLGHAPKTVVAATGHLAPSRLHAFVMMLIGNKQSTIRLTAIFLVGVCFYVFRDVVFPALKAPVAISCAIVAAFLMYRDIHFAEFGLTTFGAATLFWLAFNARLGHLQRINDDWDISYGVYLYGWPIATLIRWENPGISPWLLASLTLPLALAFGAASWWSLERWTKDWVRSRSVPATPPVLPLTSQHP
jgi:peptidoglycan/LPS O-acetylase OafA/YrhL